MKLFVDTAYISSNAYAGRNDIEYLVFGPHVQEISDSAFVRCRYIKTIQFKSAVCIGSQAFSECIALTTITFTDRIRSMGAYAFAGCRSLRSVCLPRGTSTIPEFCFYNCVRLENVKMDDGITKIGAYAFCGCERLRSVRLGHYLKTIYQAAFWGCTSLQEIRFPPFVETIAMWCFRGCNSLVKVELNEGLEWIGSQTFIQCEELARLVFPRTDMRYIGQQIVDSRLVEVCRRPNQNPVLVAWVCAQLFASRYIQSKVVKFAVETPKGVPQHVFDSTNQVLDHEF